jgi:hypothetical protein
VCILQSRVMECVPEVTVVMLPFYGLQVFNWRKLNFVSVL